jgi:hypothetical protein
MFRLFQVPNLKHLNMLFQYSKFNFSKNKLHKQTKSDQFKGYKIAPSSIKDRNLNQYDQKGSVEERKFKELEAFDHMVGFLAERETYTYDDMFVQNLVQFKN